MLALASSAILANPIYPAAPLLKLVNSTANGHRYDISDHGIDLKVVHLYGTPAQMGQAQGELLGGLAYEFLSKAIPAFYADEIDQLLDLPSLPDWLIKLINAASAKEAPKIFNTALGYVLGKERKFMEASRAKPLDEIAGLATGLCNSGAVPNCDAADLGAQIERMNLLPELIRMTCTMLGAWGKATPNGGLMQLRALDFGAGPFANYSVLSVYHPADGHAFASLGFPGMVGAVTGWSAQIGMSEKVWETYDGTGVQKGHYDGEPVVGVIRDMLQFSASKAEAEAFARSITRTWAVFLGVGDAAAGRFDALGYREAELEVFTPANISTVTHMPVLDDLVYIDKHPQPSHDNTTMPSLMTRFYGNLTAANIIASAAQMQTGDLHNTLYDFAAKKAWLSLGVIDVKGDYTTPAWGRPYLEFGFDDLFSEKQ